MPVIKSIGRKDASFGQLVDYLHKKEKKIGVDEKVPHAKAINELVYYISQEDKDVPKEETFSYLHNILGVSPDDLESIKEAFKENDQYRIERRGGVAQYHEVMSFHPKDTAVLKDNPEIVEDMARAYLELRAPNGLGIAKLHVDKEHMHLHFMISPNEVGSSNSIRMSKSEFNAVCKTIQKYQLEQYPELKHSYVQERDEERYQSQREADKAYVKEALEEAFEKATDEKSFAALAEKAGLETYTYRDKLNGVKYDGEKYRFSRLLGNEHTGVDKVKEWNELLKPTEKKQEEEVLKEQEDEKTVPVEDEKQEKNQENQPLEKVEEQEEQTPSQEQAVEEENVQDEPSEINEQQEVEQEVETLEENTIPENETQQEVEIDTAEVEDKESLEDTAQQEVKTQDQGIEPEQEVENDQGQDGQENDSGVELSL